LKITRKSILSGETRTREIDVTQEQLDLWQSGTLTQTALSHLSADDREFIMTGVVPEEWEIFNEDTDSP